jgi:hypothetical protein
LINNYFTWHDSSRYLISAPQDVKMDLKKVAKEIGAKELRLSSGLEVSSIIFSLLVYP